MATIVVGGHSRNIGKTSVVSGLIAALPEYDWTAIKITQYGHGICAVGGHTCDCAVDEHPYAILEETNASRNTDSARFLASGARRSLWVRTKQGNLGLAIPPLQQILDSERFVILESNSIMGFIDPEMYVVVLRFDVLDFKTSARKYLSRADAAVVVQSEAALPIWPEIRADILNGIPLFRTTPPEFAPLSLREFVRSRLQAPGGSSTR